MPSMVEWICSAVVEAEEITKISRRVISFVHLLHAGVTVYWAIKSGENFLRTNIVVEGPVNLDRTRYLP